MITVKNREFFLIELRKVVHRPCIGVELGVLRGDFSTEILRVVEPSHFILVDPFSTDINKKYCTGLPTAYSTMDDYLFVKERFANNKMVHVMPLYSNKAIECFEPKTMDFIYHDASHLYADVKKDLIDWRPILTKSGLMCGHDYIRHEDFGVIQAVDEFCAEHNFEMIIFNENGGDYALRAK